MSHPARDSSHLATNLAALKARWDVPLPDVGAPSRVRVVGVPGANGADGSMSVSIITGDSRWVRVHSDRAPLEEARRFLASRAPDGEIPRVAVVVGAGAGWIVDAIEERSTTTRVLVLEPEPELLPVFLSRRDWRRLVDTGRLLVLAGPEYLGATEAWKLFDHEVGTPLTLAHPVITAARPVASAAAARAATRALAGAVSQIEARQRLEGPYVLNTLYNVPALIQASDAAALRGSAAGVPVVIAAAGPSLNRNLAELEPYRDRVVLVCVDTALRPALAAGIEPDFVVAVDPSELNGRHLLELPPCRSARLVAEASVHPPAVEAFGGRTLFFRVTGTGPWHWLNACGVDVVPLRTWGSVLTTAFDLALRMGGDPIVFIGADLAYTGGQPYCRGTVYEVDWQASVAQGHTLEAVWHGWKRQPIVECPSVTGDLVETAAHLISFRDWIVERATLDGGTRRIVNATGGGILAGGPVLQSSLRELLDGRAPVRVPAVPAVPVVRSHVEGHVWRELLDVPLLTACLDGAARPPWAAPTGAAPRGTLRRLARALGEVLQPDRQLVASGPTSDEGRELHARIPATRAFTWCESARGPLRDVERALAALARGNVWRPVISPEEWFASTEHRTPAMKALLGGEHRDPRAASGERQASGVESRARARILRDVLLVVQRTVSPDRVPEFLEAMCAPADALRAPGAPRDAGRPRAPGAAPVPSGTGE